MKINVDVYKVIETLDQALVDVKVGLETNHFTTTERKTIQNELNDAIKIALKIKLKGQRNQLDEIIAALDDNKLSPALLKATTNDLEAILSNIRQLEKTIKKAA